MTRYLILLTVLFSFQLQAQELRCKVVVNADQIQYTNKRMFKTLETSVSEFVNNTRWTKDNFTMDERIDCAMLITITKFDLPDQFTATIQVTSNRPVFNSGYSSNVFNFRDQDFNFTYTENAPIFFTPDQFQSNLASVVAFYAYLIIGMDYDTFSLEGGTQYFGEAQRVVTNAQSSGFAGWASSEKQRNRFWIVDNMLQTAWQPLRECMYNYHRKGMDIMYEKPTEGRKVIMTSLEDLKKIHTIKPLSFNVQLFFTAKEDELVGIFSVADQVEKERVVNLLKTIDPTRSSKYNTILKPN